MKRKQEVKKSYRILSVLSALALAAVLAAPASASCGDGVLDSGEDCEAPFGPCCDADSCVFAANTKVCRPSAGECDVEERCYLLSASCPPDTKAAPGIECTDSTANDCKKAQCDGSGACDQNFTVQAAGASCDSGLDTCAVADTCNGSGTCRNVGGDLAPLGDGDDDGDTTCDSGDTCPHEATNDADADGVCAGGASGYDNCPTTANANQADSDHDGVGDACDTCTDSDGDGVKNAGFSASTCGSSADNCPSLANGAQTDGDGDGVGDACDNCPSNGNGDQRDIDEDGLGDVCDSNDAPGSLLIGRAVLEIDSPATGNSGSFELNAVINDTTHGELLASLVGDQVLVVVSDGDGQFLLALPNHAAIALTGCTSRAPNKVKCESTDGDIKASFSAKAPNVYEMKLTVTGLAGAVTGTVLPSTPITVKVHHGESFAGTSPALGQIDRIASISTCTAKSDTTMICE